MKKIISLALSLCLMATAFAGCGAKKESITIFTWQNMFPQEVLDGFTKETGITVTYANFDSDEAMLSKLETAKGGDYDVIVADDYIIKTAILQNLVQKLDKEKIPNFGNINPLVQGQFFDLTNEYSVPYGAGLQTIVYNPEKTDKEIKSYEDLWDSSLVDSIGIIANYRVINGMALKTLGKSYNTVNPDEIKAAGEKLKSLAPNIRLIKNDFISDDLLSGEINAAIMYTSQVTIAKMTNDKLKTVFPKEGDGYGLMCGFVPINAPNSDGAFAFLNYILRPEVGAKCSEYIGYYSTNKAADALINEKYREFLTLPPELNNPEMIEPISAAAEEEHVKVWTEFKARCGQ